MSRKVTLAVTLLLLSAWLFPGSAQLSVATRDHLVDYQWSSVTGIRQFDTLQLRVGVINTGDEPADPSLGCEIWTETDLRLGESVRTCKIPSGPIEPGDSVWTELEAVVESPPGEYSLEWGALEHRHSGSVTVHGAEAAAVRSRLAHRIPFVLDLSGAGAASYSKADFELLARRSLTHGAGFGILVFSVAEEAASRMASFSPVLFLSFDLDENGGLEFSRYWEGGGPALERRRGPVSRGQFGSALNLGAEVYRLLRREGEHFARSVGR